MHIYGPGDEFAGDKLCPHFYDLYISAMDLIEPIRAGNMDNNDICAIIEDIARMVQAHPYIGQYFDIEIPRSTKQMVYVRFKTIHDLDLYHKGEPTKNEIGTLVIMRQDTKGHAYEQMAYALVFILYCMAQPHKHHQYRCWRKLLKSSNVPLYAKNAKEKGIAAWLNLNNRTLDKTVRLCEEYYRKHDEATIRLSPLEARMIAIANGNDDVSEKAINDTLAKGNNERKHGIDGYTITLPTHNGLQTVVTIDQGQVEVDIHADGFELNAYWLEIFNVLPHSVLASIAKQPFESICAIGVFEGLGIKVGKFTQTNAGLTFNMPKPKKGRDYILTANTLSAITRVI